MNDTVIQKIESLATEVAVREGCQIYDVEFGQSGHGRVLRVYIDKEGGVGVDDCANVSRGLNEILDSQDIIPGGAYDLEVSSPGLERNLRKPWHFEKAKGEKIWVKLSQPLEVLGVQNKSLRSAKQLTETLQGSDVEGLHFEVEGEKFIVPFAQLEKAKTVFEFAKSKPGSGGKTKKNNESKPRKK